MTQKLDRSFLLLLLILAAGTAYRLLALHWSGLNLYVDEAQYWTWAKALDWGYYSKPPVIAVIIAATTQLWGDGEIAIKAGALLLYPLTTLVLYALARRLYDARVAFWTALIFFTLPGVSLSSLIISTDVPLFLCWSTAAYALWRALEAPAGQDEWRWWLLVGLACGIGLLTKYTMGIFAVAAAVFLATSPQHRRHFANPRPYVAAALAAALFAPNLWWNAHHGWPTFHHTADISNLEGGPGLHWDELEEFLSGQAAIFGPVLFVALIIRTLQIRQWLGDERERFLACLALPFLVVISLQALLGRANANWGAMTYATGTVWMVAVLLPRHRGWLVAALAIQLTAMVLAYHYHALAHAAGVQLTRKTDHFKRVQGWDEVGRQVRARLEAQPGTLLLCNERDTMSEMAYYAHPASVGAVMWNPQHHVTNHYELVTKMEGHGGRDFLFISHDTELPAGMADSFLKVSREPDLNVPVVPGWSLDYRVWRLEGFIGYPVPLR